jgi:hypothetical protein
MESDELEFKSRFVCLHDSCLQCMSFQNQILMSFPFFSLVTLSLDPTVWCELVPLSGTPFLLLLPGDWHHLQQLGSSFRTEGLLSDYTNDPVLCAGGLGGLKAPRWVEEAWSSDHLHRITWGACEKCQAPVHRAPSAPQNLTQQAWNGAGVAFSQATEVSAQVCVRNTASGEGYSYSHESPAADTQGLWLDRPSEDEWMNPFALKGLRWDGVSHKILIGEKTHSRNSLSRCGTSCWQVRNKPECE